MFQPVDVASQFARERAAVSEVAGMQRDRLWLWRPQTTIVLTSRERELAESSLARCFAAQEWPVVLRDCGGGAVALGPACLNVSWLMPVTDALSIEAGYREFCTPLIQALAALGVHAECGPLPGSYCDGRFNLLVGGRKLAGTSQRVYRTPAGSVRLSHAVLHVLPAVTDYLAKLNEFLALARNAEPLSPAHLISIADVSKLNAIEDIFDSVSVALAAAVHAEFIT